jgi:hypothetical protein
MDVFPLVRRISSLYKSPPLTLPLSPLGDCAAISKKRFFGKGERRSGGKNLER